MKRKINFNPQTAPYDHFLLEEDPQGAPWDAKPTAPAANFLYFQSLLSPNEFYLRTNPAMVLSLQVTASIQAQPGSWGAGDPAPSSLSW